MKSIKISLIIIICFLASCKKKAPEIISVCGVQHPLEELTWLKNEYKKLVGGKEINAIVLYDFEGKQVIEIQGSTFSSTNQHQYYCNGDKLDLDEPSKFNAFIKNRIERSVLYGTKIWQTHL